MNEKIKSFRPPRLVFLTESLKEFLPLIEEWLESKRQIVECVENEKAVRVDALSELFDLGGDVCDMLDTITEAHPGLFKEVASESVDMPVRYRPVPDCERRLKAVAEKVGLSSALELLPKKNEGKGKWVIFFGNFDFCI